MKLKQWYNFLLEENSGCNEEVPVLNIFTFLMEFYLENIHDLIMEIGPWLNATESRGNALAANTLKLQIRLCREPHGRLDTFFLYQH